MSYADAAAKGPKQSAEEILEQSVPTRSTVDVDSPAVSTVPSNWSGETDTQYERIEREAAQAERRAKESFHQAEQKASKSYDKAKKTTRQTIRKVENKAEHAEASLRENSDNPVVVGNIVVWTAIAAGLGFGAYRQNQAGTFTWRVAASWAGVVGVFAAGDYYLSQYLFKNKYPRK